jgi:hypothetical protein
VLALFMLAVGKAVISVESASLNRTFSQQNQGTPDPFGNFVQFPRGQRPKAPRPPVSNKRTPRPRQSNVATGLRYDDSHVTTLIAAQRE